MTIVSGRAASGVPCERQLPNRAMAPGFHFKRRKRREQLFLDHHGFYRVLLLPHVSSPAVVGGGHHPVTSMACHGGHAGGGMADCLFIAAQAPGRVLGLPAEQRSLDHLGLARRRLRADRPAGGLGRAEHSRRDQGAPRATGHPSAQKRACAGLEVGRSTGSRGAADANGRNAIAGSGIRCAETDLTRLGCPQRSCNRNIQQSYTLSCRTNPEFADEIWLFGPPILIPRRVQLFGLSTSIRGVPPTNGPGSFHGS